MLSWVSSFWAGSTAPLPADPNAPLMFPAAPPGLVLRSDDQLEYTQQPGGEIATRTYRANRAMVLDRVILGTRRARGGGGGCIDCVGSNSPSLTVTGIVLPYWECTVTLATPKTYVFMGFEVLGGFSMNAHESDGAFFSFSVGDTVGIGINSARHVYFTRNGKLLEHANKKLIVPVAPSLTIDVPVMRIRGGACVFRANFGDDAPFAFNPFAMAGRWEKCQVGEIE